MRFAVFSDLHGHAFKEHSFILPNGVNSRLQDALDVIFQIYDYCWVNKIKHGFFLGDLFHSRGRVHVETFNRTYQALKQLSRHVELHLIAGNHDFATKALDVSVLETLAEIARVYEEPASIVIEDVRFDIIPYREDLEDIEFENVKTKRIFLGHLALTGAVVGAHEYSPESPISLSRLKPRNYKFMFFGHYHKLQQLAKNAWYVGSSLQQNFGERDNENVFFDVDTDRGEINIVPVIGPKFIVLDEVEGKDNDKVMRNIKGNFVKVIVAEQDYHSGLREAFLEMEALSVEFEIIPQRQESSRLDVALDSDWKDIVAKYVNMASPPLQKERLVRLGKGILDEVD